MKLLNKINLAAQEKGISSLSGKILMLLKYPFKNYLLCELASHVPNFLVPMIHRLRGVNVGQNVCIDRTTYIDNLYPDLVNIEDGARITAHCVIVCHVSAPEKMKKTHMPFHKEKVIIKKNAFVGVNSTILPGTVIGEDSVISAGSVVSGNVPDRTLVGGNPARAIKVFKDIE